jgi:hypothetical protein
MKFLSGLTIKKWLYSGAVSISAITICLASIPQLAHADDPDSGNSAGGRSTTPRDPSCPVTNIQFPYIQSLTPKASKGEKSVTVNLSQSPTFYFYSSHLKGKYRFRLLKSQKSRVPLYSQDIAGFDKVGIFAVSLPVLTAIKPQEYYFWELEYLCSDKPNVSNPMVFGRLYRDRLTTAQKLEFSKLETSSDRLAFYQKYGIWSERLDEIAKLLPTSQLLWQQTLDAEGLQAISKQSVLFSQPSPKPSKP